LSLDEIENFEVLATVDQGLFHAGLAIASVYYDTGTSDLYHCQQTLKIVSRRLSDSYLQSSDETIGAVGLLLIHDVFSCTVVKIKGLMLIIIIQTLTGAADNSSLHLYGLERMVDARGGLHFLPDRLRRTLSMYANTIPFKSTSLFDSIVKRLILVIYQDRHFLRHNMEFSTSVSIYAAT